MSEWIGNQQIVGGEGYAPPLLSSIWSDHIIDDMSWLRADTFSWQDGVVYFNAYQELLSQYNHVSSVTETESGITFKRTPKGYKIADSTQEQSVSDLYNLTGVAWYYILDTANHRFKLPRTKYGFNGFRDSVGNYIAESLPNITGQIATNVPANYEKVQTGAVYSNTFGTSSSLGMSGGSGVNITEGTVYGFKFNASRSSSTYQDNAPVQERATQMYLYFFVGQFRDYALIQSAGITAETLNGKADTDFNNLPASSLAKLVPSQAGQSGKFLTTDGTNTSWGTLNSLPVGTILPYGGASAPEGYLLCNGGEISRTTYAGLFAIIGTAYGAGDGSTTFNLPNANSRYLGYNGRGYLDANLPNIIGSMGSAQGQGFYSGGSGALYGSSGAGARSKGEGGGAGNNNLNLDASRSSTLYTSTNEVRPLTLRVNCIIKY